MTNEVLGTIRCTECDGLANVFQATRRGAHLYVRCAESPSCGMLQPTGARPQTRWYYKTQWIGEPPPRPGNVPEGGEFVPDLPKSLEERAGETIKKALNTDICGEWQAGPELELARSAGSSVRVLGLVMVGAVSMAALWRLA